jgi:hypothetical protein
MTSIDYLNVLQKRKPLTKQLQTISKKLKLRKGRKNELGRQWMP